MLTRDESIPTLLFTGNTGVTLILQVVGVIPHWMAWVKPMEVAQSRFSQGAQASPVLSSLWSVCLLERGNLSSSVGPMNSLLITELILSHTLALDTLHSLKSAVGENRLSALDRLEHQTQTLSRWPFCLWRFSTDSCLSIRTCWVSTSSNLTYYVTPSHVYLFFPPEFGRDCFLPNDLDLPALGQNIETMRAKVLSSLTLDFKKIDLGPSENKN